MYRYIRSAQATASQAKKLSTGWRQAYVQDVKNYRYQKTLLTKHHDVEHEFSNELQTLLNKYVDSKIATTKVYFIDVSKSQVRVSIYYKVAGSNEEYHIDYYMPSNNFDVDTDPSLENTVEVETVLKDLTKTPYLKNLCDKYTEDLIESYNSWQQAFLKSDHLVSFEFFAENIVGSGLFIPQSGNVGMYYKPLRVGKDGYTIICQKCYYKNGELVAKQVNKGYDTLEDYASNTFTLLTERQVINREKSYTY